MSNLIGKQFGQYTILSQIGRGGMAVVYRASQPSMDREVAIKVMAVHIADDENFIARFEREVRLIAHLQHPHILPVYDFGSAGDYAYLVMRLVEGGSLAKRLQDGPIPLAQTSQIFSNIASALSYAHSEGIIHRDVKPNNILLDTRGNPYLMDFGLARMAFDQNRISTSQMILGTPGYMSPEQWRSEGVDQRSDVYALGITLYEMLTGDLPFRAETPHALMYKHLNESPPSPRDFNLEVPEAIVPVLNKALAKRKEDRFESADVFAVSVAAALKPTPYPPEIATFSDKIHIGQLPTSPSSFMPTYVSPGTISEKTPPRQIRSRTPLWIGLIGLIGVSLLGFALTRNLQPQNIVQSSLTPTTATTVSASATANQLTSTAPFVSILGTSTAADTSTPSASATLTLINTSTTLPLPTLTPSRTIMPSATNTFKPSSTPSPTPTPTWTATATISPIPPSVTPTDTPSISPSPTEIPNIPLLSRDYVDIVSIAPPLTDGLVLNKETTISITVRYKAITAGEVSLNVWLERFQDANCTMFFDDGYIAGDSILIGLRRLGTQVFTFTANVSAGPYVAVAVELEQPPRTLAKIYSHQRGCYKVGETETNSTALPFDVIKKKDFVYIYTFYATPANDSAPIARSGTTIGYKITTPGSFLLRASLVRFADENCTTLRMNTERNGTPEATIAESLTTITVGGPSTTGTGGFGLQFPALSEKVIDAPYVMVFADIIESKTSQILGDTKRYCIPTTLFFPKATATP